MVFLHFDFPLHRRIYEKKEIEFQNSIYFLFYRNSVTPDGQDLVVTVLEAKELTGPVDVDTMDTFVRIYLVPDENGALQTKVNLTLISY